METEFTIPHTNNDRIFVESKTDGESGNLYRKVDI
jgi:hypothetical protein